MKAYQKQKTSFNPILVWLNPHFRMGKPDRGILTFNPILVWLNPSKGSGADSKEALLSILF